LRESLLKLLRPTDSEHYVRRWRHRKTELYREIQLVRQDLGALTAIIELEQKAWLSDLQQVAALLQPSAKAGSKADQKADADGESGSNDDDSDDDDDDVDDDDDDDD
jgi:hypothetical protein